MVSCAFSAISTHKEPLELPKGVRALYCQRSRMPSPERAGLGGTTGTGNQPRAGERWRRNDRLAGACRPIAWRGTA